MASMTVQRSDNGVGQVLDTVPRELQSRASKGGGTLAPTCSIRILK